MAKEDSPNPKALDVTDAENHISVQVSEIKLYSSRLTPLEEAPEDKLSKIAFHITALIHGSTAFSKLSIEIVHVDGTDDTDKTGCCLDFDLLGIFTGSEKVSTTEMVEFAKMYTLSLLWPYAREYASDQLRRTGLPFTALPIINPQVVTEKLIRGDYIQVSIVGEGEN